MRNELALGLMVLGSLILALLFELIPLPLELNPWRAPWLLVMVVFWVLYLPGMMGIGLAWGAGLFMDAASGTPLGTHALIFTLASALTLAARRLLLTFSVLKQAAWIAALSFMQYGILSLLLPSAGLSGVLSTTITAALLWVLLHFVLFRRLQARLRAD